MATLIGTVSSSSHTLYPLSQYLSYSSLSPFHNHFSLSLTFDTKPTTFVEVGKFECWRQAMQAEISTFEQTRTRTIGDLPFGVTPIGNKQVYRIKIKANGSIECYKACLVAKGHNQVEGLNHFDTFSLVAKVTPVRLLLAIASTKNQHLHQMDVNAFLHGDLHEDVYMSLLFGFPLLELDKVCKLLKSFYDLNQASCQWFEKLSQVLKSCDYKQAESDHSLFTKAIAFSLQLCQLMWMTLYWLELVFLSLTASRPSLIPNSKLKTLDNLNTFLIWKLLTPKEEFPFAK